MKRTPLRRPIPPEQRDRMSQDPFYSKCCIKSAECSGRIEWHHALTYKGTRIDDPWSIVPMCTHHHKEEAKYRREIMKVIYSRVTREQILKEYPKMVL